MIIKGTKLKGLIMTMPQCEYGQIEQDINIVE